MDPQGRITFDISMILIEDDNTGFINVVYYQFEDGVHNSVFTVSHENTFQEVEMLILSDLGKTTSTWIAIVENRGRTRQVRYRKEKNQDD
ncbi:hypothetical protein [Pontibacillus salipaludis]|uniref:Uncharacterized protein n=1 Tax=Pontibacillus salipaludis TaxID=1697394 RepID=A0ABQ1PSD9_9BACI|nr:hypothetical protein [Pontibacillus salipaludis]GGD02306.1 hypothetical protein GCM10011389_07190 [Pontibacillus salipaludis]